MATTTSNLSLRKPESTDVVNVALDIAANMQTIDDKWASSAAADIAAAAAAGSALTVARTDHAHKVGSGTVSAPGLPVGESNTGLYRIGAGELGVTILGTLVATFDAVGLMLEKALTLKQITTPSNPSATYERHYIKSDHHLYGLDSSGTERIVRSVGAAADTVLRGTGADVASFGKVQSGDITVGTATLLKIAEVSGTGASATIEFTSIPATYRSLEIHLVGRSTNASGFNSVTLTFESSPTAGSYNHQRFVAFGTSTAAQENIGATSSILVGTAPGSTAVAAAHGAVRISLIEYANTNVMKTSISHSLGVDTLASAGIGTDVNAGIWESTTAIDRVRLSIAAGSWTTTTRATLYGIPA
jgi:hypothetical protein